MREQGPSQATAWGESDRRGVDAVTVMHQLEKDTQGEWGRVYFTFKFIPLVYTVRQNLLYSLH